MKSIIAFLLITLIYISGSQDLPPACQDYAPEFFYKSMNDDGKNAYSRDFCRSLYLNTELYYTCCFIKWKDAKDIHRYNCYPVTPTQMANIDPLVDSIKGNVSKLYSLDCSSSYLYGSLLLILALLF